MAFHQYNTFEYNTAQYNADAFFLVQNLFETQGMMDADVTQPQIVKLETVTNTDTLTNSTQKPLVGEVILSLDSLSRQITDKRLSATVRLSDWLSISNSPQSDPWE